MTRTTTLPMRWPGDPTGDIGLPVTPLSAETWVTSLLLIRTAVASSFVNKFGGHTLEIVTRRSKHRKPVINTATWVTGSHLRIEFTHAVVDSLVNDILACRFRADGPSHFHVDCRVAGLDAEVTLTFEFPD